MGSCFQADRMERKELPLFTRHKRILTVYIAVQKLGFFNLLVCLTSTVFNVQLINVHLII